MTLKAFLEDSCISLGMVWHVHTCAVVTASVRTEYHYPIRTGEFLSCLDVAAHAPIAAVQLHSLLFLKAYQILYRLCLCITIICLSKDSLLNGLDVPTYTGHISQIEK